MDLETKILNVIHCCSSDKIFNITLKWDLDLTILVQRLEISPQFQHNNVHILTALIIHIGLRLILDYLLEETDTDNLLTYPCWEYNPGSGER